MVLFQLRLIGTWNASCILSCAHSFWRALIAAAPQFVVYNAVLRRWPAGLYEPLERGGNLFPTTIFVLVSAVQKLARAARLPQGLVLYRGLGGALDLPEQFFRPDGRGCRGFAEWGFMSTTSEREVALRYSGAGKGGGARAMVLEFRIGPVP